MTEARVAEIRLKYLVSDVDGNDNVRFYVRKPGARKIRLRKQFGTPEFLAEYQAAIEGKTRRHGGSRERRQRPAAHGDLRMAQGRTGHALYSGGRKEGSGTIGNAAVSPKSDWSL